MEKCLIDGVISWLINGFIHLAFHHQANSEYDPGRCYAFVHDLGDEGAIYPVPEASLDVIVLIFVLSALHPDK